MEYRQIATRLRVQGCPGGEAIDAAAPNNHLTAMAYQAVLSGYSDYDFDFGALHITTPSSCMCLQ